MNAVWRELESEIARWRDSGREVAFWWRDDDAGPATRSLARLLALAATAQVPLALAVVPEAAEPEAIAGCDGHVEILQHGVDHRNRAAPGEKKTEFSSQESVGAALERLRRGHAKLAAVAGGRALAVLAPPWNRLPQRLIERLSEAGFRGLSTYGARGVPNAAPGVWQVNTHVDIVAWREEGAFVGEEAALRRATERLAAQRIGGADFAEPTGWLTHHARHDEAAWTFLARLFEFTKRVAGLRWRRAAELFHEVAP